MYPEYLVSYIEDNFRIAGQVDLLIKDGNDIYIIDYKGLPLDTPIATENGWKLLKDLTKSDKIFDKDGNLTNILNISEIHNNPCYKIKFDNGEEIVAGAFYDWCCGDDGSPRSLLDEPPRGWRGMDFSKLEAKLIFPR